MPDPLIDKFRRINRLSKKVALQVFEAIGGEIIHLFLRFYTFCHDDHLQAFSQINYVIDNMSGQCVGADPAYETLVYFKMSMWNFCR